MTGLSAQRAEVRATATCLSSRGQFPLDPSGVGSSCKTLKLDLGEGAGMEHPALFQFTK